MRALERYASLGSAPDDASDLAIRKRTLTIAATVVMVLAIGWTATYLLLGRPLAAAIPGAYLAITVIGLAYLWRTKRFDGFRSVQLTLMLVLPFVLQWVLGGFESASAVCLWALVAALGAVYFIDARQAIPWFAAFVVLVVVSGVMDPLLAANAVPLPYGVRIAFFVLNIGTVALVAYILLQYFVRDRERARAASDGLLRNILPDVIADRLKSLEASEDGARIADLHADVTVLFADIVGFTAFAERAGPDAVVDLLDRLFTAFDGLADDHGLEKIKTIGDAYMVAGGLPTPRPDHAEAVARMALQMLDVAQGMRDAGVDVHIRIGVETGPVVAGIIGRRKFSYDLWGDTVNTASRMEALGERDTVALGPTAAARLASTFRVVEREPVQVKGKGLITPSHLQGPLAAS